jgi:hypothetical protein
MPHIGVVRVWCRNPLQPDKFDHYVEVNLGRPTTKSLWLGNYPPEDPIYEELVLFHDTVEGLLFLGTILS